MTSATSLKVFGYAPWVRASASILTIAAFMSGGCESQPADVHVDGGYVQSPMGYVPPHETQEQVPIQIGPQPVPMVGGSPSIHLPDQTQVIDLTANVQGFEPAEIVVTPGQVVTVRLINRSDMNRGLRIELPDAHASIPQDVGPGESRTVVFTAPLQPGTYTFHSSSGGEHGGQLEGRLIVRTTP